MYHLKLIRCGLLFSVLLPLTRAENCASGWTKFESKCYFITSTQLYEECSSHCPTYHAGATMLCIESMDENNFIQNHLPTVSPSAHIGYFRNAGNQFVWFPGCSSSFTNWAYNEPNNADGTEIYAQMYADRGTWNDYHDGYSTCACEYTLINPADDYVPLNNNDDTGTAASTDDNDDGSSPGETIGLIIGLVVCIIVGAVCAYYRLKMWAEGGYGWVCCGVPCGPQATPGTTVGGRAPAPYTPVPYTPAPYTPQPYTAQPAVATAPPSAPYPYTAAVPAQYDYPASAPAPYPSAPTPYATASAPYASAAAPYPYGPVASVPVVARVEMVPVGSGAYDGYAEAQVVTAESTTGGRKF